MSPEEALTFIAIRFLPKIYEERILKMLEEEKPLKKEFKNRQKYIP
jgi:hypothetical protein